MTEALITLLDGYRRRRDGYLSTASAYKGCHAAKGVELRKIAAVCDMHIRELQTAIEEWRSVSVQQPEVSRSVQRRTRSTGVGQRQSVAQEVEGQGATGTERPDQAEGSVDVPRMRDDNDGTAD